MLSRRAFLLSSSPLIAAAATAESQINETSDRGPARSVRELRLAKEFKDAYLRAVSPDGKNVCAYFTRHPNTIFTLRRGEKGRIQGGNPKEEHLAVFRTVSWETVYSGQFVAPPGIADFFAGSSVLYMEFAIIPGNLNEGRRMTLDLATGLVEQRVQTRRPGDVATGYRALDGNALLGIETSSSPYRHNALLRAMLPDYKEVLRVPFAPSGKEPDGYETFPFVSSDRASFVYAFGHTIVCRRTKDLAILWTAEIEKELFGTRTLAISADGGRAAVAVIDTDLWDRQRRFYVAVYDGKDGTLVSRIPVNGDQGLAVSPDGESLAVAKRIPQGGDVRLVVDIYQVTSGKLVATATHDRVPSGRDQILNGQFDHAENGLQFTPDGRFLVTSGNNRVKVWEA